MKKVISSFVVVVGMLLAGQAQASSDLNQSVMNHRTISDKNITTTVDLNISDTKDADVNITKHQSIGKTIVQVIVTPIFIAGAIVAFVVISPIWLIKKMTGTDKNKD